MRYPLLIAAMLAVASMCSDHASAADKRSPPFGDLTDEALWRSSLMDGAFNELRCRGFTAKEADRIYSRQFASRERQIRSTMLERYGPLPSEDIILIGKRCPAYRGAIVAHEDRLRDLERRLGLKAK